MTDRSYYSLSMALGKRERDHQPQSELGPDVGKARLRTQSYRTSPRHELDVDARFLRVTNVISKTLGHPGNGFGTCWLREIAMRDDVQNQHTPAQGWPVLPTPRVRHWGIHCHPRVATTTGTMIVGRSLSVSDLRSGQPALRRTARATPRPRRQGEGSPATANQQFDLAGAGARSSARTSVTRT
jgi:hypothetical protein